MKRLWNLLPILVYLFISPAYLFAEAAPPVEGGKLPDIRLLIPTNADHQSYLGVKGEGTFSLSQIKASVIVLEIFSMYCPHCQKEAPRVNDLYAKIQNSKKLKDKVKMVGIGVGNSPFEVEYFKKTYSVPFPLFSDGDFVIHKQLGEVRTPYFIGITHHKNGSHAIFYSKLGAIADNDGFLKLIEAQLNK
jgi:peroxiredoxin